MATSESNPPDADPRNLNAPSMRVPERWMPQTSIRFFLALIALSAVTMLIFRSAADGPGWTRIAALLITTIVCCFISYAVSFLIGNLFSTTGAPIVGAIDTGRSPDRDGQRRPPHQWVDPGDSRRPDRESH